MSLSPIPWSAISPLFLLLLPIMAVAVEPGLQIKYNGYKLYRLDLSREEHRLGQVLELLEQLEAGGSRFNANGERMPLLDVWTDLASGSKKHQSQIEALVAPEFCTDFLNLLHDKGVPRPQLMNEDIQIQIDREKREIIQRRRRHRRRVPGIQGNIAKGIDLNSYNSYRSITDYLTKLAAEHPRLVLLINFTRTFEGRDLLGVKVGKRDDGQDARKPLVFIDAGVHAREWIAPAAALYVLDKMVSVASKSMDPTMPSDMETQQMAALLDRLQFVFLPVGNPDGYEYSRNRDRLWRKTRSRNESMHRGCVGADANRNWGYRWAETGASRSPCSNIFPGWAPFSEPEVEAVRAFLAPQLGRLAAYISLHSYGQLILSPWGYTTEKPDNFGEQRKLAELAAQAIRESTGARYTFGSIADLLYPASGTSIDYWQHKGVPYIYGVELRPEDVETELHGFAIPPDQIEPTGKEMAVFVKRVGEYLLQRKEKTLLEKEAEMSPIAVGS